MIFFILLTCLLTEYQYSKKKWDVDRPCNAYLIISWTPATIQPFTWSIHKADTAPWALSTSSQAIPSALYRVQHANERGQILNTERSYKWRLSGSAGQSEIGILCFDWLIHPGVSYSREICNFSGEFVIFQATAEGKIFRLFAFFLKRSAKTTRMTSTEHEFRHLHLI